MFSVLHSSTVEAEMLMCCHEIWCCRDEGDGSDRLGELLCPTSDQELKQSETDQSCAAVGFTASWSSEQLQEKQREDALLSRFRRVSLISPHCSTWVSGRRVL